MEIPVKMSLDEWNKLIAKTHIVVGFFFNEKDNEAVKMEKILEKDFLPEMAKHFDDTLYKRILISDSKAICEKHGVTKSPTLMVFHKGVTVSHLKKGADGEKKIEQITKSSKELGTDLLGLINELHRQSKK